MNFKRIYFFLVLILFSPTAFACDFKFDAYQMTNFKLSPDAKYLICGGDKRTDFIITSTSIIDEPGAVREFEFPPLENADDGVIINQISPDSKLVILEMTQTISIENTNDLTKHRYFIAPISGGKASYLYPNLPDTCALDQLKFSSNSDRLIFGITGTPWHRNKFSCPAEHTGYFSMTSQGKELVRIHENEFKSGLITSSFMLSNDEQKVLHFSSLNMHTFPSAEISSILGDKPSIRLVEATDYQTAPPTKLKDFITMPVKLFGFLDNSRVITLVSKDGITEDLILTSIDDTNENAIKNQVLLTNTLARHEAANLIMGINQITVNPNGTFLVISKLVPGLDRHLFSLPANGGEPILLTKDTPWTFVFTEDGQSIVYSLKDELIHQRLDGTATFKYDLRLKRETPRANHNTQEIPSLYSVEDGIFHLTTLKDEKCGPSSAYSLMRTPVNGGKTIKLSGFLKRGNCGVVRFGFTEDKKHIIYLSFEEENGKLGFYQVASDGSSKAKKLFDKYY